ncbi:MAG: hypothetical protein ACYDDF_06065 [Thermoplasmatota archaeon]
MRPSHAILPCWAVMMLVAGEAMAGTNCCGYPAVPWPPKEKITNVTSFCDHLSVPAALCHEPVFVRLAENWSMKNFSVGGETNSSGSYVTYAFNWVGPCDPPINSTYAGDTCSRQAAWFTNESTGNLSGPGFEQHIPWCSCPAQVVPALAPAVVVPLVLVLGFAVGRWVRRNG